MAIKHVLVPVDGSESSLEALAVALELAAPAGASVTVLQVIEEEDPLPTHDDAPPPGVDRVTFLAERRFQSVAPILAATRVPWQRQITVGNVPKEICRAAEQDHSDMVIMGSRGLAAVTRLLLGSVSDYVAKHAPCSVLIARQPHRAG